MHKYFKDIPLCVCQFNIEADTQTNYVKYGNITFKDTLGINTQLDLELTVHYLLIEIFFAFVNFSLNFTFFCIEIFSYITNHFKLHYIH